MVFYLYVFIKIVVHDIFSFSDSFYFRMFRTFDQPSAAPAINVMPQHIQPPKTTGPFGLDPNKIAEIEKDWVRVDQMERVVVPSVDISLLFEPIKVIATKDGVKYPQEKFEQLLSRSRYMQQTHTTPPPPSAVGGLVGNNGSPYLSPQQQQQQFNAALYQQTMGITSPKYVEICICLQVNCFLRDFKISVWLTFCLNMIHI